LPPSDVRGRTTTAISAEAVAGIEQHARAAAPEECCGLLLGTPGGVTAAVRARNIAHSPRTRYEIAPEDHFEALRRARSLGVDVVGAYHSHPHSPPIPSATDRSEAFEAFLFLIVGLAARQAEIRAWQLMDGNFVEVALVRNA